MSAPLGPLHWLHNAFLLVHVIRCHRHCVIIMGGECVMRCRWVLGLQSCEAGSARGWVGLVGAAAGCRFLCEAGLEGVNRVLVYEGSEGGETGGDQVCARLNSCPHD